MKDRIRSEFLERRKTLSQERKKEAHAKLKSTLWPLLTPYKRILSYYPLPDEVDLSEINGELEKEGRLALPKIEGDHITPYAIEDQAKQLKRFDHLFLEPNPTMVSVASDVDCVLVPAIAFDGRGHRVGFGKGYYDRYLEGTSVVSIGVGYKEQLHENLLPVSAHDVEVSKLCFV